MKKLYNYILNFILKGHARSVRAKKNIIASFGIKGVSIIIGFVKVPIILSYLNVEKYGVWLTIASIVDWVNYFDLGIGNGLRNKFTEALALNDTEKAKKLVSTAYYYVSLLVLGFSIIIIPTIFFLDWQKILNITTIQNHDLLFSVLFVFVMVIFRFVFNLITVILKADQKSALSDVFMPISSVLVLIFVLLLSTFSKDSLLLACVAISLPPTLIMLFSNFLFFRKKYFKFKPSFKSVDKYLFKDIFSLGFKFFFLQMAGLVLFSSSNIILTQVVNPSEVTLFNISRQFFGIPFMLMSIIITPMWSAITDAYTRGETRWIKNAMNKLFYLSILFSLGLIVMLVFSDFAFKIWLRGRVTIPFNLSLIMVVYNIFFIFCSPLSHFLNGTGKLKLGLYTIPFTIILFIPTALLLAKYFGAFGLVLALILINSIPSAVLEYIQYKKIITNKAHGIWNK